MGPMLKHKIAMRKPSDALFPWERMTRGHVPQARIERAQAPGPWESVVEIAATKLGKIDADRLCKRQQLVPHLGEGFADQRSLLTSTTVQAVMLTMRRTVADGVSTCTGLAAPSSTGPIATL